MKWYSCHQVPLLVHFKQGHEVVGLDRIHFAAHCFQVGAASTTMVLGFGENEVKRWDDRDLAPCGVKVGPCQHRLSTSLL